MEWTSHRLENDGSRSQRMGVDGVWKGENPGKHLRREGGEKEGGNEPECRTPVL